MKIANSKLHKENESLRKTAKHSEKKVEDTEVLTEKLREELLLKEKSLMSSMRSLIEILRRIWKSVEISYRKIRTSSRQISNFDQLVEDPLRIDVLKLYDEFEEMLSVVR